MSGVATYLDKTWLAARCADLTALCDNYAKVADDCEEPGRAAALRQAATIIAGSGKTQRKAASDAES